MRVRILSLVCMSTVLGASHALADELPTPIALGQIESLLDSCSARDPQAAPNLKKQREQLVQGASQRDLVKLRASDEYKDAYKEISDRFEGASKEEALTACKVFLGRS